MDPEDERRARNEDLLRAKLNEELLAGRAFVEGRLSRLVPGLLGRLVNPLARALYHAIGEEEVRRRAQGQLDLLFAAAREIRQVGFEAAVAAWAERVLATEEVVHRGNRAHPLFPEVRRRLVEMLRDRLALTERFLASADASTFEAGVRAAFPERAELERELARQIAEGRSLMRLVQENPSLIRFPRALLQHLFPLVDETTAWYEARLRGEIEGIYASAGSGRDL